MTSHFQDELLASRVNIKLDKGLAKDKKEQELPFKILAMGDYSHGGDTRSLDERPKHSIEKVNFDLILAELNPKALISVPDERVGDGSNMMVRVEFSRMSDFTPEALIENVDVLRSLLETRTLLSELKATLVNNETFRHQLEQIMIDEPSSIQLRKELEQII